jgi:hypothetical protein
MLPLHHMHVLYHTSVCMVERQQMRCLGARRTVEQLCSSQVEQRSAVLHKESTQYLTEVQADGRCTVAVA